MFRRHRTGMVGYLTLCELFSPIDFYALTVCNFQNTQASLFLYLFGSTIETDIVTAESLLPHLCGYCSFQSMYYDVCMDMQPTLSIEQGRTGGKKIEATGRMRV